MLHKKISPIRVLWVYILDNNYHYFSNRNSRAEENGLYGVSNFVIVYPPFTEPDPPTPSPVKSPSHPTPSTPTPPPSSPAPSNLTAKQQTPPKLSFVCPALTPSQIQSWVPDRNSFSNGQIYCSKNMVLNFDVETSILIALFRESIKLIKGR